MGPTPAQPPSFPLIHPGIVLASAADHDPGYHVAGYILAHSGAKAVAGWMRSSGHRDNLLNAGYKEVGFGIAESAHFQNSHNEP